MQSKRWLLPEGVQETVPPESWRLEAARRALLDLYWRWGYELIRPPLIEYLDSLLTGAGHELDLHTFKLTDQLNGRMMGVRSDMTTQATRIDAHRLAATGPARYCYIGSVLRTRPDEPGGSRSPLQVGRREIRRCASAQRSRDRVADARNVARDGHRADLSRSRPRGDLSPTGCRRGCTGRLRADAVRRGPAQVAPRSRPIGRGRPGRCRRFTTVWPR